MGFRRRAPLAAVLALLSGLAAPAARPEEDPFAPLEDPARRGADLEKAFAAALPAITSSPEWSTVDRKLVLCARGDGEARRKHVATIREMEVKGRSFLTEAGLPVGSPPDANVAFVAGPPGSAAAVGVGDQSILLRVPAGPASPGAPALRKRLDGPPVERDVVECGAAQAAWAAPARDRAALRSGTGGLAPFLARRLLSVAGLPEGLPGWFREGLARHVASRMEEPLPPGSLHLPAPLLAGDAAAVDALLADGPPSPDAGPVLGRLVGTLLDGRTNLREIVDGMAGAKGLAAQGAVLGKDVRALALAAAADVKPLAAPCAADGSLPCAVCIATGNGKVEVSCPSCDGTGYHSCPSCYGDGTCFAGNCEKGMRYYEGGAKVRCRFCKGGVTECKACKNIRKIPCPSCKGRGKFSRNCPACVRGRTPCPHAPAATFCGACGGKSIRPCPWCADGGVVPTCDACGGPGFSGCKVCFGTGRSLCDDCEGMGETRMVYSDGTPASVTKCASCNGRGFWDCRQCKEGRIACEGCGSKGLSRRPRADCPLCGGAGTAACGACSGFPRAGGAAPFTAEESATNAEAMKKAVDFLLRSTSAGGEFALRKEGKGAEAGAIQKPTTFSNAHILWALLVTGIPRDDPRVSRSWAGMLTDAARIADGKEKDAGVQATAFVLRALLVGGEPPASDLVRKLVDRLVAAQRPGGLWNYALDGSGGDDNILTSLIAVEALHVARTRGIKVPLATWNRAFRAGSEAFGNRGPAKADKGWLDAIDVLSNLALIVTSKAGILGDKAGAFDYASIPDVQVGLAWLDRHFSVTTTPTLRNGALHRQDKGGAYFAYLFALQRLGMLLRIDRIGGESWHVAGARHFLPLQRADGSFEEQGEGAANGPVRSTAWAVLFLMRATVPLTDPGESR